jgi:hypothetical protein
MIIFYRLVGKSNFFRFSIKGDKKKLFFLFFLFFCFFVFLFFSFLFF